MREGIIVAVNEGDCSFVGDVVGWLMVEERRLPVYSRGCNIKSLQRLKKPGNVLGMM